jgi:hypothetical protein
VTASRGRTDSGIGGEATRGQSTTVGKSEQDPASRRIGNQSPDYGNVDISAS